MNVFSQRRPQISQRRRRLDRPAWLAALLALALGLAGVWWWATVAATQARAAARSAALAAGKALELEFSQALHAAEMLGMLARQSGGTLTNFQKLGAEMLRERPGLATLELQPGGVVADIVPRAGNERAIGVNVMNDPAHRPGAAAALKKRSLTVDGPVPLYRGEPGLVVRVPVFQTGRDGRETFRGFVAVSVRLSTLLTRARTDELRLDGYGYQLSAPGPSPKKPTVIVRRGAASFADAVRQPVRLRDTEFELALRPVRGWFGTVEAMVRIAFVLLLAGLAGLLAHALARGLHLERALAEANHRADRETEEHRKLEESVQSIKDGAASVQAELRAARNAAHEAETALVAARARAETAEQTLAEAQAAFQTRLQEAEARAAEKLSRLEAAGRAVEAAARAKDEQLEQLRAALHKAQQANRELETRLAAAERSTAEAARAHAAQADRLERERRHLEQRLAAAEEAAARIAKLTAPVEALLPASDASAPAPPEEPAAGSPVPAEPPSAAEPEPGPPPDGAPVADPDKPETKTRLARPARRKRARRNNQMDLFGGSDSEEESATDTGLVAAPPRPEPEPGVSDESPESPTAADQTGETEAAAQVEAAPEADNEEPAEPGFVEPAEGSRPEVVAESRPEPTSNLPAALEEIEGLAAGEGLARVGGDVKAYLKTLKTFAETESGTPDRIRDALEQGDSNQAHNLAQELAHAAGEIGAESVQEAALAVVRGLQGRVEPDQLEFLWADLDKALRQLVTEVKAALKPREEKPAAPRAARPPPPINLAEFRKAVHTIVPLFAGQDPGAKDCFKDNRAVFRSAFSPEGYAEFEQLVKKNDFEAALEHLRKTAKRHGIPV
jgi:HPt (histidine-containing phosphotransfer) domain-containing protein